MKDRHFNRLPFYPGLCRFYEPLGTKQQVELTVNRDDVDLVETDLLERDLQKVAVKEGKAVLEFEPFEIKTLKLS